MVLILLAWLSTAMALTLVQEQVNDAGDLPLENLQDLSSPNAPQDLRGIELDDDGILEVRGDIVSIDDVDMYLIEITNPEEFSAISFFDPNASFEDAQLFLFDRDGKGICANDENPEKSSDDPERLYAALAQGSCSIPERGFYYLAISTNQRDPVSNVNDPNSEIFPDEPKQEVVRPDDPNAVVRGWNGSSVIRSYVFQITGINDPPPDCFAFQEARLNDDDTHTISFQAQDERVGIESITEQSSSNISKFEFSPEFDPGEMDAITVTVTTTDNPNMKAEIDFLVTNTRGVSRTCSLSAPQLPEEPKLAPECFDVFSLGGRPVVETTVQDTQSGLRKIDVVFVKNATLTIDGKEAKRGDVITYNPPITRKVVIRAEKKNLDERATVVVEVFDNDIKIDPNTGEELPDQNSDLCDPILFLLKIPDDSLRAYRTYIDIPEVDHFISILNRNGEPESGLKLITIQVNNAPKRVLRLNDGEVKQLDVAADMVEGLNKMTFMGVGRHGTGASIAVSNQQPEIAPLAPSSFITRGSRQKPLVNQEWER